MGNQNSVKVTELILKDPNDDKNKRKMAKIVKLS